MRILLRLRYSQINDSCDSLFNTINKAMPGRLAIVILAILALAGCKSSPNYPVPVSTSTLTAGITKTSSQNSIPFVINTLNVPMGENPVEPVQVEMFLYEHPEDLFSIQAPKAWGINPMDHMVTFTAPEDDAVISVSVFNTGYPFDGESFHRFFESQEADKALKLESYIEIDRKVLSPGSRLAVTSSYYESGVLTRGISYYQQNGQEVLIGNFQVQEALFDAYQDLFESIYLSAELNEDVAAGLSIYSFDQVTRHTNGHFSFLIPLYWEYSQAEEENVKIETFRSPDENAIIQSVVYNDGQFTTRDVAGKIALDLLRNHYTNSITVTEDKVQGDGREILIWYSKENPYQGMTAFATKGTEVQVLTIIWGSDPEKYYQSLLEDVFSSYQIVE